MNYSADLKIGLYCLLCRKELESRATIEVVCKNCQKKFEERRIRQEKWWYRIMGIFIKERVRNGTEMCLVRTKRSEKKKSILDMLFRMFAIW